MWGRGVLVLVLVYFSRIALLPWYCSTAWTCVTLSTTPAWPRRSRRWPKSSSSGEGDFFGLPLTLKSARRPGVAAPLLSCICREGVQLAVAGRAVVALVPWVLSGFGLGLEGGGWGAGDEGREGSHNPRAHPLHALGRAMLEGSASAVHQRAAGYAVPPQQGPSSLPRVFKTRPCASPAPPIMPHSAAVSLACPWPAGAAARMPPAGTGSWQMTRRPGMPAWCGPQA